MSPVKEGMNTNQNTTDASSDKLRLQMLTLERDNASLMMKNANLQKHWTVAKAELSNTRHKLENVEKEMNKLAMARDIMATKAISCDNHTSQSKRGLRSRTKALSVDIEGWKIVNTQNHLEDEERQLLEQLQQVRDQIEVTKELSTEMNEAQKMTKTSDGEFFNHADQAITKKKRKRVE